jgi:WD repeat and SOF domain-containing protein 1
LFSYRWKPFDPARNWPDLGPRFAKTEQIAHDNLRKAKAAALAGAAGTTTTTPAGDSSSDEPEYATTPGDDKRDLDWSTVMKRTFEGYIRGETPNMYGEWLDWVE